MTGSETSGWVAGLVGVAIVLGACGSSSAPSRSGPGSPPESPSPLIDVAELIPGGPPRDGIPPIDHPAFEAPADVEWLEPQEPVLAIEIGDDARAYPARILIWHEIVNDSVGGRPTTITYCPLCNTGVAFERPTIDGELLDFGTSGKLYRSNLVMYDRQTESLWPQVTGQAVLGPLTGTQLVLVPVQMVAWQDWRATHPDGKVLSAETGFDRDYGSNPYVGYDQEDSLPFLYRGDPDPRLRPKARVVGVLVGKDALAVPYQALRQRAVGEWSVVTTTVGDRSVVVLWKAGALSAVDQPTIADSRAVGATGVFDPRVDGRNLTFVAGSNGITDRQTGSTWDLFGRAVSGPLQGEELDRIVSIESFWFDWAGFHPRTRILG